MMLYPAPFAYTQQFLILAWSLASPRLGVSVSLLQWLEMFHVEHPDGSAADLHFYGAGHVELGRVEG